MNTPIQVQGRISLHPRGFGFLNVEPPNDAAVASAFIAPPDANPFFAGDLVSATVSASGNGRFSASALKLIKRDRATLFGEMVLRKGAPHLKIDRDVANTDWPLDTAGTDVKPGELVIARVDNGTARLLRKLDAGADVGLERVMARYSISEDFSPGALADAREALSIPHALGHRRDLRNVPTVTVDAPSTRDIDDAISVLPAGEDGALRLLVSIADPSEFVHENGALDLEARDRATSVYLTGKVLPMLPDTLSSDWISLLPGQDRLALTVEMRVDPEGRITASDVYESLIRSATRLNYEEVAAFLDRGVISNAMQVVKESMPWFRTAGARLGVARARRGGVVIERDEARVTFDPQRRAPTGMEVIRSNSAHQLIERFMVAANEAIGEWLSGRGVPAPYRVHDEPEAEQVAELEVFARNFGYIPAFGGHITPLALAAFDAQISGAENGLAIRSVLQRGLGPARYTVKPSLHFGLAAPLYLHFTSPIRRYADLMVHRALKRYLRGERAFTPLDPAVETQCRHMNERAFLASRAERDRRRMLEAQLMSTRVGETFHGHVTRVKAFGLLVQLDATLVEGLLPAEALTDGPYETDPRQTRMTGPTRSFTIGTPVTVKLASADAQMGRIEFSLV